MSESKFSKPTDSREEVKLEPALIHASWRHGAAFIGSGAAFEVRTVFVGNGAKIEISGKTGAGKKLAKISDTIGNNVYVGSLDIPAEIEKGDEVYFEVKLPKNGLQGESERIPVLAPPRLVSLAWSASEARRGDVLALTGEFEEISDDAEVLVTIYEQDGDGAHDKVAEIPALLKGKKLELMWEYEYHEGSGEIPTAGEMERHGGEYNPPEYFFTASYNGFRMGAQQESGLLTFKDHIEIELCDCDGNPAAGADYVLHLADGSTREGTLDAQGCARVEGIAPGSVRVEFPGLRQVDPATTGRE